MKILLQLTVLASLALTGCAMGPSNAPGTAPAVEKGSVIKGRAFGGQQPVTGASIQLYAAGSGGYGSASTPLISTATLTVGTTTPVNTDGNGGFTITGDFNCPTPSTTPVYLVITGGNPGNANSTINNNLALMAVLGPCNDLVNVPFVNVNELTTVASVWALAPFMSAIDHVGSSATNTLGLANAFASVNKLINIGTGSVGGPSLPAGATLPVDEIYALGDILATCINSIGTTGTGDTTSNCGKLFVNTNLPVDSDTVTAALAIAHNPSQNAGAIFREIPSLGAQFPTTLAEPAAWTIVINYTGGGLKTPTGIANDDKGNVWVANSGNNSVTMLSNLGAAQSGADGFTVGSMNLPSSIAIDTNDNVWVTNSGNSTLTELDSTGTTGTVFSGNGLSIPKSIAFDASGNIWVANSGASSVSAFTSTGTAIGNYTGGGISTPIAIAVNPQ